MRITADSLIREALPLIDMLSGSLYYPCCGFDGRPVRYLAIYIHSFIYVDYGETRDSLMREINSDTGGFRGYELLGQRDASKEELVPRGRRPVVVPNGRGYPVGPLHEEGPFCTWFVFQRSEQYGDEHGPDRFSLLYLCADGAAAYQALFSRVTPRVVAIIQPGNGFGGNYTDYYDSDGIFAKAVRATGNALPEFVLSGGAGDRDNYREPIWPAEYNDGRGWIADQAIRVWGRAA